jgi:hypothetical protein
VLETLSRAGDDADKGAGPGNVGDPVLPCSLLGFPADSKAKGTIKKTVTAKLVEIYFRYDHTMGGPNVKLLKPSPGDLKDAGAGVFSKPEWNDSGKNDPVSTTMKTDLVVDLVIDFTVTPAGQTASLTHVQGVSGEACMNFDRTMSDTVGTEKKIIYWLQSKDKTPDSVQRLLDSIAWTVTADGNPITLATSGPHVVYSTFGIPWGKMSMSRTPGSSLEQTGNNQDVTEERLKFAVACAGGKKTERECADGVFNRFKALGLQYSPGNRWPDTAPQDMTLHHYLWKLANKEIDGECHMLAAAFILVCEMLGVPGPFEIGYMRPWGRRDGAHPYNPRPDPTHGKYNTPDTRNHTVVNRWLPNENHNDERLIFVDSNSKRNNFEGVASYKGGSVLYAIGDSILDKFGTADQNTDSWYKGANFDLCFTRGKGVPDCDEPYPPAVKKTPFKWSD